MKMNNFEMNPEINGIKVEEANAIKVQHIHNGESTVFEKMLAWLSPERFAQTKDIDIETARQHLCNMQQFLDNNPDVTELSQGGIIVKKTPMPPQIRSEIEQIVANAISLNARKMIQEQINLEKIALNALEENKEDKRPNQPIDNDWLSFFQDNAKAISSEEAQSLWGKILAQESKSPGSFSLRALQTLRIFPAKLATKFETLIKYSILGSFLNDYLIEKEILSFADFTEFQAIGLLSLNVHRTLNIVQGNLFAMLSNNNTLLCLEDVQKDSVAVGQSVLTELGQELSSIIPAQSLPENEYLIALKDKVAPKAKRIYIIRGEKGENGTYTFPLANRILIS